MSELTLPSNPTIADLQAYVARAVKERGFSEESISGRFMLLTEEIGEFAKAARKHGGLLFAEDTERKEIAHEAADVLIVLLGLCNMLGVDLEKAFRDKEEINKKRTWK